MTSAMFVGGMAECAKPNPDLICPAGKSPPEALSSLPSKIFPLAMSGKSSLQARPSRLTRGAYRDRHGR
jgi:hypothetical protein